MSGTLQGHVESLWRYPVKSMRGEARNAVWIDHQGLAGDRRYAIRSSAAPRGLPYLTSRTMEQLLLYRPFYRDTGQSAETAAPSQGGSPFTEALFVETPGCATFSIDDPRLLEELAQGVRQPSQLSVERSHAPLTDEMPVSLFSLATAQQLSRELNMPVDKRRFRANLYLDLLAPGGFAEDAFIGRQLLVGQQLRLQVERRDPRCKVITLSPDTAEPCVEILRHVAAVHGRCAGVYASVLEPGWVHAGDPVALLP